MDEVKALRLLNRNECTAVFGMHDYIEQRNKGGYKELDL